MTTIDLLPLVADITPGPALAALFHSWDAWIQVVILLALILINAFLVAADVALSRVHTSQLEEAASAGKPGAALTLKLLKNSGIYSAACQVGITAASIVLGALGEPVISSWLYPLLSPLGINLMATQVISFFLAVSILTFLSLVIGELLPKALGTQRPVGMALASSQPLRAFYILVAIPVWVVG